MPTKICPVCNIEFIAKHSNAIHCSRECWKTSCQDKRSCPICGKIFLHSRSKEKTYCSRECSRVGRTKVKERVCPKCGQSFIQNRTEQIYCSFQCGNNEYHGKTGQNLVTHICEQCGVAFKQYASRKARFCSRKCQARYQSLTIQGVKHYRYRGGSPRNRGRNWHHQSHEALKRDGYRCQICHKPVTKQKWDYGVHHIIPYRLFNGDYGQANQLSNLITLCNGCHSKVENGKLDCPTPLTWEFPNVETIP